MPELSVTNLNKSFLSSAGELPILRNLDLRLTSGDAVAVTGPSGSGKSTLLYCIGTLDRPTSGQILLDGQDPFTLAPEELARFRNRQVGFVFQDHHLLPQCSALENVLLPTLAGTGAGPAEHRRAQELLNRVGLSDRHTHRPGQLSGGERQRVALCRALINSPPLLLADEPTGNLDPHHARDIGSLLLELAREFQTLLLVVTHSLDLASRFPRRMELVEGRLHEVAAGATP